MVCGCYLTSCMPCFFCISLVFCMPKFLLLFIYLPRKPACAPCLANGHSAFYYTNNCNISSHSVQIAHNNAFHVSLQIFQFLKYKYSLLFLCTLHFDPWFFNLCFSYLNHTDAGITGSGTHTSKYKFVWSSLAQKFVKFLRIFSTIWKKYCLQKNSQLLLCKN